MNRRRVEPLPTADFEHLAAVLPHGEGIARVTGTASAEETAKAVDAAIRDARGAATELTEEQIAGLGVLWGKAVSQASGWTWARVVDGETNHVCLVSQDHAHACLPLAFVAEQVQSVEECKAFVLFEMIAGARLPAAEMEALVFVG